MIHNESQKSQSKSKYRKNNEKMFGFFYSSLLISFGISIAIYGASIEGFSEKLIIARIYYSIIYFSSVIIIISLWIYLFINRMNSYESFIKGGNDSYKFKLSKRGEKVNMYLRLGLAMFGICSLIYVIFATYIRFINEDVSFIFHGISQALFILVQTLFVLFYHRLVTLIHINIMKFALLHLIISNMLMWANASIGKVSSEFESGQCSEKRYKSICILCVYLLPTVSEYTVIAAAIIYEIYLRIGKVSLIELKHDKKKKDLFSQFFNTFPGLFGGALLLSMCMLSSISSVVLYFLHAKHKWIYNFHNGQMIILNIFGIILLIIAFFKINKMKFSVSLLKSSLDKNILYVSYILTINFLISVCIICGKSIKNDHKYSFSEELGLRILSAVFEIIQVSLQTHFIIDCFQRCSYDNNQKKLKPGKHCLAILIGINFGMWFLWTLQIKYADIVYLKAENRTYQYMKQEGTKAYGALLIFFLQSALPLGMLYRYHSSACLSDIYAKIYQTESERFVDHLRSGKLQKENGILSKETVMKHKSTTKKTSKVKFTNLGYDSDKESVYSSDLPMKKRSQSLGIIPLSVYNNVKKKMIRRATLKNMEDAQYKFISEQLSHQMLQRKMTPEANVTKLMKDTKNLPNVNKMLGNFISMTFDKLTDESESDSAYSI